MDSAMKAFLIILCVFNFLSICASVEPEVVLSTGRVRGLKLVSVANRLYYSFMGIPYAAPPVGYLRFKPPQPPKPWNGVLEAFNITPACSQPWRNLSYPETYSEDCLHVNVFTPYLRPPKGALLPVMVWVHGGKLYEGASTPYKYGPDFLITGDVVLVSFNYRLGVFGYLNLNTPSAQGNVAEKDKVALLKWVQREIRKFGGDPNLVTIFGGSSGGQDVNCLYVSPMAQGLFHRAISQSGGACTTHPLPRPNPGIRLAEMLGCPTGDVETVVACLRTITAQVLAEKQMEVVAPKVGKSSMPFLPSIEEDHGEEMFFKHSAAEYIKGSKNRVPYLLGMNSGEGKMDIDLPEDNPTQFSDFERDFELYLPEDIRKNSSRRKLDTIVRILKSFYFGDKPITFESVYGFMNFMTDMKQTYPTTKLAKSLSTHTTVYLYYFVFEGQFDTKWPNSVLNLTGVGHGDELGYMFYRNLVVPEQNNMSQYPRECITITHMVRLWTNFAKYGNPTPDPNDVFLRVTWLPVNNSVTQHLVINDSLSMNTSALLAEREAVWETVYGMVVSSPQADTSIAMYILSAVLCLSLASLAYLLYTSSCTNAYIQI